MLHMLHVYHTKERLYSYKQIVALCGVIIEPKVRVYTATRTNFAQTCAVCMKQHVDAQLHPKDKVKSYLVKSIKAG